MDQYRYNPHYHDQQVETPHHLISWSCLGRNNNISGYCRSGELFAFLGLDDTKTKLLEILAGKKSNSAAFHVATSPNCTIMYNQSDEVTEDSIPTVISHLNINDANYLYANLTVMETLVFSAELRTHNVSGTPTPSDLMALKLLSEMGLEEISNYQTHQLSLWQKRALILATEVIASKNVILFDQPTNDLDASSALSLITCMQRCARNNRLIALSASSLTFREYAIIDRIQLLSNNGYIYIGLGSSVVSHFMKLGRAPTPGSSIADFVLDLVDEIPGLSDLQPLEMQASRMCQKFITPPYKKSDFLINSSSSSSSSSCNVSMNTNSNSSGSGSGGSSLLARSVSSSISKNSSDGIQLTNKYSKYNKLSHRSYSAISTHGTYDDDDEGILHYFTNIFEAGDEEYGCPKLFNPFFWILWRSFIVRYRNIDRIINLWVQIGSFISIGLLLIFWSYKRNDNSASSDFENTCSLLTILPYSIQLLSSLWNMDELNDLLIFSYERNRKYYSPVFFPISSLIADLLICRLFPPVIVALVLYPFLGLKPGVTHIMRFVSSIALMSITSACLNRFIFNCMTTTSTFLPIKATMLTTFVSNLQILYTGLLINLSSSSVSHSIMKVSSIYYWGCNVLYYNELGDRLFYDDASMTVSKGSDLLTSIEHLNKIDESVAFTVLAVMALIYMTLSIIASLILHKDL